MTRQCAMFLACACLLAQVEAVLAGEDVPALINTLQTKGSKRRVDAAAALGAIGPNAKDAVPALLNALKTDSYFEVRCSAAVSLGQIGARPKVVVPALVEVLKNATGGPDVSAAIGLGLLGPKAKDAVPALIDALKADDGYKGR